jgi:hypothetical protein
MSKPKKPFSTPRRSDSKTYQITLNTSCGLPAGVCREWQRQSFQKLPGELAQFRQPKTKAAAQAGAVALNEYLKKSTEQPNTARRERFRGGLAGRNRGLFVYGQKICQRQRGDGVGKLYGISADRA